MATKTSTNKPAAAQVESTSKPAPKSAKASAVINNEAELLSMSEDDYMNAAQLAFFKQRLQAVERELLQNAGETTEHLRETVIVPDPADRATIEEEHALELRRKRQRARHAHVRRPAPLAFRVARAERHHLRREGRRARERAQNNPDHQ